MANLSTYVNSVRQDITALLDILEKASADIDEYDALGGTLFVDANNVLWAGYDITQAEFVTAVASIQAIKALLAAGHSTNLYKMKV